MYCQWPQDCSSHNVSGCVHMYVSACVLCCSPMWLVLYCCIAFFFCCSSPAAKGTRAVMSKTLCGFTVLWLVRCWQVERASCLVSGCRQGRLPSAECMWIMFLTIDCWLWKNCCAEWVVGSAAEALYWLEKISLSSLSNQASGLSWQTFLQMSKHSEEPNAWNVTEVGWQLQDRWDLFCSGGGAVDPGGKALWMSKHSCVCVSVIYEHHVYVYPCKHCFIPCFGVASSLLLLPWA